MRIVVVGIGAMGWNHARVCSELGVLVGICDQNDSNLRKAGEEFQVPSFKNIETAILETNSNAVIIATPTTTHHDLSIMALELNQHILVEKPLCENINRAENLVKLSGKKNLTLAVGHIERHNPVIKELKNILISRELGDVITFSSKRASSFPKRVTDIGVILDLAIHDIDNAIYLMDSIPTQIYSIGGKHKGHDFEDFAHIMIRFENGKTALVEVNWVSPMRVREAIVTLEKALIKVDYMSQEVTISKSKHSDPENPQFYPLKIESEVNTIKLEKKEPLKLEIEDFIKACLTKSSPLVSGKSAVLSLKTTIAALESLVTNKSIVV